MQFAERIRHSCDKGSQSKSRSHIAKFAPFFFDRLLKNHAGIFKAQIMAENTENNKQFELEEEDLKMIRKTSHVNTHRSSIVGDEVHVDFVASSQ